MQINFEERFDKSMLKKGYDYYYDDRVENVITIGNVVTATVIGNKDYNVEVILNSKNNFKTASCNCPYADGNWDCKHVVAVCYHINNDELKEYDSASLQNRRETELKIILNKIPDNMLKDFLEHKLIEDNDIYSEFKKLFLKFYKKDDILVYKQKIRDSIDIIAGNNGFIDYRSSNEYTEAMYEICEEANNYIDNEDYLLAFGILTAILDEIPEVDIDDSDGSTGYVQGECIEKINKILDLCDQERDNDVIHSIFSYFKHEIKTGTLANYGLDFTDVLKKLIEKELCLDKLEILLKEQIKNTKPDNYLSYLNEDYVKLLLEILYKCNRTHEAEELMKNNLDDEEILLKYIDLLLSRKDYTNAIKSLKDAVIKESTNSRTAQRLMNELLSIYQETKMEEEYKSELYNILYNYNFDTLGTYKKIKSLYNEKEWKIESENIIAKMEKLEKPTKFSKILEIYIAEHKTDKLFNVVKNTNDYYYLRRYEEYLIPKYEHELVDLYISAIRKESIQVTDRKTYIVIAENLKHTSTLRTGEHKVKSLIEEFRTTYRNRRAMMEEISKV